MKKYNTPEMNVSMFNCETVATSGETLTASQYTDKAVADGRTVRIYDWSQLQDNGITVGF